MVFRIKCLKAKRCCLGEINLFEDVFGETETIKDVHLGNDDQSKPVCIFMADICQAWVVFQVQDTIDYFFESFRNTLPEEVTPGFVW
ncbi:hypothetical protein IV203_005383 [Nitzschia inconspicua]|uniref:Uncharacterized protein n=1 Tax=Nitzschia inconspicua TaxID=303405 RepID=A0A9K3PGF7_9STRA|nr:hypothetical protein IV203_005383 [Nitzschia inconspicua]